MPLDSREDAPYQESIAVLQEVEPSAEYSLPSISAPEIEFSGDNAGWSIRTKLLLVAVALVLGGTVLLIAMLLLLAVS